MGSEMCIRDSLYHEQGVKVVPGSFLGRDQQGLNPGADYIRCALVADEATCNEAVKRIASYL